MKTHCNTKSNKFKTLGKRNICIDFNGGQITSDAGVMLLSEIDNMFSVTNKLADCFKDFRNRNKVEHSVRDILRQRIYAIATGYEDVNDHDLLSLDPLFATAVGKFEPTGKGRKRGRDKKRPLAGKSTVGRLERSHPHTEGNSAATKITVNFEKIEKLPVEIFLDSYKTPPDEIILDFDATDDQVHGNQEKRFFNGYYDNYCFLPLYAFCDGHLLLAKLRPSNIDGAAGTLDALKWMIPMIRERWTDVKIMFRGDSGFCRVNIIDWCENNDVDYVVGIAKNNRLKAMSKNEMILAEKQYKKTNEKQRIFGEFEYKTLKSWKKKRRVIVKAEYGYRGSNPRFIVTNILKEKIDAQTLYEKIYCQRGEMENRIKEQQLSLFADRTSCHKFYSNQLRLWFSSFSYILLHLFRKIALAETDRENIQCGTIRLKFIKIGALIKVTTRRIVISMSSAYPYQDEYCRYLMKLRC